VADVRVTDTALSKEKQESGQAQQKSAKKPVMLRPPLPLAAKK
jgi:hypothetical protein